VTSDFLADLDAAIESRCACRCGRPITGRSPSAYFASEMCADRWHGRRTTVLLPIPPAVVEQAIRDAVEQTRGRLIAALRAFHEIVDAIRRQLAGIDLEPLVGELPPTDPWQQALWLRRRRNTGPRPVGRAPRRLDPAGGLRVDARGRPTYRPARAR
jgi:hypothetical protein